MKRSTVDGVGLLGVALTLFGLGFTTGLTSLQKGIMFSSCSLLSLFAVFVIFGVIKVEN